MNNKAITLLKNFSHTLISNLISLVISTIVILIVPKLIGVQDYGYWQLYLFYSAYVGFLHFGWNDGIYLRYGGKKYGELDKREFFSQFYTLVIFQLIIAIIIFGSTNFFVNDNNRLFVLEMTVLAMIIVNLRDLLLYVLSGTNRIKDYANITILDRVLYVILIIVFLLIGAWDFKLMIVADLVGKFISLVYAMYCCKEMVFRRIATFYINIREILENVSVGIKLMLSNIAALLIIGVVRFGIERAWNVETFGKVSLSLSISYLMMLFINAVGIIMFPILRRTNEERLPNIYVTMRDFLMVILLGTLLLYYPLKVILSGWLPNYSESLMYLALIFPMCIFDGKSSLLVNTYLKTMRKEKLMLKINLISLILSIIITLINVVLIKNLNLTMASIILISAFRSILAEIYLSIILKISVLKDTLLELTMTMTFVLTGWFIDSWLAFSVYAIAYIIYIFIKKKDIVITFNNFKSLIKI